MKIVALDIGGTSIKSGLYVDNKLIDVFETDSNAKNGSIFVMENAINILKKYKSFDRIGISTAGQVNPETGVIIYANNNIPNYKGTNVKKILEDEFHVPVAVDNDVNCAAMGEGYFGAGKGYNDFLCLAYGTGVGGAIFIDGKVYTGSSFSAGEVGAMIIHPEDRDCKKDMYSGCYEMYASTTALVKKVKEVDSSILNGKNIFENLHRNEIVNVVNSWIDEVIYGLVTLTHIFNPSCIILGGGIMEQEYILQEINKKLFKNIMDSYRSVKVLGASLGNRAGLYGAIYNASKI